MPNYPIIFIDESGTAKDDPYFGLGLLKVKSTHSFQSALLLPHNRCKSHMAESRKRIKEKIINGNKPIDPRELNTFMHSTRHHEFHFTDICPQNIDFYLKFLEEVKKHEFHFSAIVIDKEASGIKEKLYWDTYIDCTKLLLKESLKADENAFVVADYMTKPRKSNKIYEDEILNSTDFGDQICNVMMTESVGVPLIQVCDLFLGAVMFENRFNHGYIKESNKTKAKKSFLGKLTEEVLNIEDPEFKLFTQDQELEAGQKLFKVSHVIKK